MNEELQNALLALVNKAETGVDFLQSELPEVIRQLLMWKAVESFIYMSIFVLLMIAFAYVARRMWKSGQEDGCGEEAFAMFPGALALVSGLVAGENLEWLQIWIAPKVYLIEYAASLAK